MIGSCNCPITASCPNTLSDYNFVDKLEQNIPVYAPITFEEVVHLKQGPWLLLNNNFSIR